MTKTNTIDTGEVQSLDNNVGFETLMAFENGELDGSQVAEMFQKLINSGMAWKLQGFYGRTAMALIEQGICQPRMHQIARAI